MNRRMGWLVAALLVAGCNRAKTQTAVVETAPAERRTIVVDAQATGTVEPINVVEVKSKSSGQIVQMPVEVGSLVRPGELLVQLDTRDVKNQYDQSSADLRAAEARLEVAIAQQKRSQELFDQRIITSQEIETANLEYANANTQVVRARASLDLAQQRLDEATVRASVGTAITSVRVSVSMDTSPFMPGMRSPSTLDTEMSTGNIVTLCCTTACGSIFSTVPANGRSG